ncbi:MAG: Crp/Fnr family transcriptional regulator [Myxococcota bacterium]
MSSESRLLVHRDFLRNLPKAVTDALESQAQLRRLADQEAVFRRGDDADGLYGVKRGSIQVIGPSPDGREHVLTVLSTGEWFGELSMMDDLPRTHDNLAVGETELWFVPKRAFRALLDEHPEFWPHFAELLSRRVRMLFELLEDAVLLELPRRLAKRLLEIAGDHGRERPDGAVAIELHLPQEKLAAMVGATREATGRHLRRWETDGWIRIAYGRIEILDRDALRGLIEAA